MNKVQEAKLNMYHAVQLHLQQNTNITAAIPAIGKAANALTNYIHHIQERVQSQVQSTKGVTIRKAEARQALTQETLMVAGSLFAFAVDTTNAPLQAEANLSAYQLSRFRDELLAPRCRNIYEAALLHLDELADYGITPQTLQAYEQIISGYAAAVPTTRNATSKRSADTIIIKELFAQTDKLLSDKIDRLALHFQKSHPEFYAVLISSRMIVDNPVTHTQIKGIITNAEEKPISYAQVTLAGTDKQATTSKKGRFAIKGLPTGIFTLLINKEGYHPYEAKECEVRMGKALTVNAALVPSPA